MLRLGLQQNCIFKTHQDAVLYPRQLATRCILAHSCTRARHGTWCVATLPPPLGLLDLEVQLPIGIAAHRLAS